MVDSTMKTEDRQSTVKYLKQFGINKCPVCRLDLQGDNEYCPFCGTLLKI